MTEFRLYKSKKKAYRLLLLCSPFILLGLWMVVVNINNIIGWFSLLFFGISIPIVIYSLLDKRPQIIINEIGIFDRTILADFINWEVIQDAYLLSINNQKFVSLEIDETYSPSLKKSFFYKITAKLNKVFGAQELNLNLSQIEVDEIQLLEFIRTLINANAASRNDHIIKMLKTQE